MTLDDAIALQPAWVQAWLYVLIFGIVFLPLSLFIWRQTRLAAVVIIAASILAGLSVQWLYGQLGYVKLLGLPHIILWTPLCIYLFRLAKTPALPAWPQRILWIILAVFLISLAFDYVDLVRYLFGDRSAVAGTVPQVP